MVGIWRPDGRLVGFWWLLFGGHAGGFLMGCWLGSGWFLVGSSSPAGQGASSGAAFA